MSELPHRGSGPAGRTIVLVRRTVSDQVCRQTNAAWLRQLEHRSRHGVLHR